MHQGQGMVIMGIIHTLMLAGIRVFWRHIQIMVQHHTHITLQLQVFRCIWVI